MADEYSFPPYQDTMQPLLAAFGGTRMESYRGLDVRPLWDLRGGSIPWSFKYLYAAPKLEKIVFSVQSYRDMLMTYTTLIWPDDSHALPIFSSFWAESAKGSYCIIDLYPLADCICDLSYLERYLDPLDDAYSRGLTHFREKSSRNPNWFHAMSSPYSIVADFGPSTQGTQQTLLDLTAQYLQVYTRLWQEDEARDDETMRPYNRRKEAIRTVMRENDPGGFMLEKAVGKERADLTLQALF